MRISPHFKLVALWLCIGTLAAGVCSLVWPAAHLGEEYLPVGNDSFYHARRIIDTAVDPSSFYQFDRKIHAPEGSLLTWPWGYDYAMGWLVRIGIQLGLSTDPMRLLAWFPVVAVFFSIGLVLLLGRQLRLSPWPMTLAGLCVAMSPMTQYLHGVGFIDHHYVEYIFVLATLVAGLSWFQNLHAAGPAIVLGLILGLAPAIQNGLFILQLPVLANLVLIWAQGKPLSKTRVGYFSTALLATTLAILIPSLPFRLGRFEYHTLSWFQLYIAICTCIGSHIICRIPKTTRSLLALGTAAITLLIPIAYQTIEVSRFLAGTIERLNSISEMQSIRTLFLSLEGPEKISKYYSLLIWLSPATLVFCVFKLWHERGKERAFLWLSSICGLAMLYTQVRFHYFGTFALYIPWLVAIDDFCARHTIWRKQVLLSTTLAFLLLYTPSLRFQLTAGLPKANDESFTATYPLLMALKKACADDPGIVLADNDVGHYIRYYTDCSVIANNFLLTKQHEAKIRELDALMSMTPRDLLSATPSIKYVLVRPIQVFRESDSKYQYVAFNPSANGIIAGLLLTTLGSEKIPRHYVLLDEVLIEKTDDVPWGRLYKIRHSPESRKSPISN